MKEVVLLMKDVVSAVDFENLIGIGKLFYQASVLCHKYWLKFINNFIKIIKLTENKEISFNSI